MTKHREDYLSDYYQWLTARGVKTKDEYLQCVREYLDFLETEQLECEEATVFVAQEYRGVLVTGEKRLSHRTVNNKLNRIRSFYHFLFLKGQVEENPFDLVQGVRMGRAVPKGILRVDQMRVLLTQFQARNSRGLMCKALVEILYGSALRISEAGRLKQKAVDWRRRLLLITDTKGGTGSRWVPASEGSILVLQDYLETGWKECVPSDQRKQGYLFPQGGVSLLRCVLNRTLKAECIRLGLPVVTSHCFRHTAATHLLKAGAGIREVQALLGHRRITSTQRYTQVVKEDLKQVVHQYHPREEETEE